MHFEGVELIIVLLTAVVALAAIAERVHVPYPMFLLIAGAALAFTPGLPHVELEPELVFLLFLPPVLFGAGYFTSWRDFKANRRPIALLSLGCVTFTTFAVAWVARMLMPEMNWSSAIVLGAIVSPPDAMAATTIFQRLGAPRRVVTILEGESLVNDASALILYRFAVAAVATGAFSMPDAITDFLVLGIGGVALGIAFGWLMVHALPYAHTASLQIAISLVAPVFVYFLAEEVHVSGVLAAVAAGIYFGRHSSVMSPEARVGGTAAWSAGTLMVNALVFVLIGLQLRGILEELSDQDLSTLLQHAAVISLAVIVVRFVWVFPAAYLPRVLIQSIRDRDPSPSWQSIALIGWSGLRGVVSLASALALPLTLDNGEAFPYRNEIIFFAFAVIVVTLLGQGSLLPVVMQRLGIGDDGDGHREVKVARRIAVNAAVTRLDELRGETWVPDDHHSELQHHFAHKIEMMESDYETAMAHAAQVNRLAQEVNDASRRAIMGARDAGHIGDEARVQIENELDLERLRARI